MQAAARQRFSLSIQMNFNQRSSSIKILLIKQTMALLVEHSPYDGIARENFNPREERAKKQGHA